jgi:hypothetical protein
VAGVRAGHVEEPGSTLGVGGDEVHGDRRFPDAVAAGGDGEAAFHEGILRPLLGRPGVAVQRIRRGSGGLGHPPPGELDVTRVEVVPHVAPSQAGGGDQGRAAAHEGVEDQVVAEGVEPDELLGQLDGEGRGVTHPPRALGRDRPDVEGEGQEVVGQQGALVRQAFRRPLPHRPGPVKTALAGHDDPLGEVAEDGVGRAAERAPGAGPGGPLGLLPDQLPPQQQAEAVLEDADDVGREAAVGLAAEVGHVHRHPPPRFELAAALGEHVPEQLEVLEVGARHPLPLELFLVGLAGEVGRGGDDQGDRAVVHLVHATGVTADERLGHRLRGGDGVVFGELGGQEALVEGRRVVALPLGHPEIGRGRRAARGHRPGS